MNFKEVKAVQVILIISSFALMGGIITAITKKQDISYAYTTPSALKSSSFAFSDYLTVSSLQDGIKLNIESTAINNSSSPLSQLPSSAPIVTSSPKTILENLQSSRQTSSTPASARPVSSTQSSISIQPVANPISRGNNLQMVFKSMPPSNQDAIYQAVGDGAQFRDMINRGITPVVVLEPIRYRASEFGSDTFWSSIDKYYSEMARLGFSANELGHQLPFPEANLHPTWGPQINPNASVYVVSMNKYISIVKKYFPAVNIGPLLDVKTHPRTYNDWGGASNLSFESYVVPLQGINLFYMQGFPWISDSAGPDYFDAYTFTGMDAMRARANWFRSKGIKVAWNTGAIVQDINSRATTRSEINNMLDGIANAVISFNKDYPDLDATVNFFLENKLYTDEGRNWDFISIIGNTEWNRLKESFLTRSINVSEFRYNP
jgi:hypothetical protein